MSLNQNSSIRNKACSTQYLIALFISFITFSIVADDWTAFMHDATRSGISSEQISTPLNVQWVYKMRQKPSPAWPPPAPADFWHNKTTPLDPLQAFDRASHIVSAGNKMIFGSSSEDKVTCLDVASGNELWHFYTEGPVRFAPTIVGENVIFGCDDGFVYSVMLTDGSFNWKYRHSEEDKRIPGNQRLISTFPVRTDALYSNDKIYFGAGLFPEKIGARRITLNLSDGSEVSNVSASFSPQGYMKSNGYSIMCPTGRTGDKTFRDGSSGRGSRVFNEYYGAKITVGGTIIQGYDGRVSIGNQSASVNGKAYSCAFANGRLFVSTDEGYIYCFGSSSGSADTIKPVIENFPYSSGVSQTQYAEAAKKIVEKSGFDKGYCLILDADAGYLAYEIAKISELQVICVEDDAAKVEQMRKNLDKAGVHGQVSVHHITSNELPYTNSMFNIVVHDGVAIGESYSGNFTYLEIERVLRPYGGTNYGGSGGGLENPLLKGGLTGAGEWTHNYNNPENNPFSTDQLVKGVADMDLQWFGRPGPERRVDRHNRQPAPLWVEGIMFVPGQNWMTALDAYNGTILWDKEVPLSSRLPGFRDAGHLVAQKDFLYVASDNKCILFDNYSGAEKNTINIPSSIDNGSYCWGYIAVVDQTLFGSAENDADIDRIASKDTDYQSYFDFRPWAVSDHLFAKDRTTGAQKWLYSPKGGGIVNTTIIIHDGKIIFVESGNSSTLTENKSRFQLSALFGNGQSYVVALDAETGSELWRKPYNFSNLQHTVYMIYSHNKVIVSGTYNKNVNYTGDKVQYEFYAFNISTGEIDWTQSVPTASKINGDHGDQDGHPVVVGDRLYLTSFHEGVCLDVPSGSVINWDFERGGHGCSQLSATMNNLYYRGTNPVAYDIKNDKLDRFTTTTRSGCWINMIPAGGLLSVPDYSSGCNCEYSMQTSLTYITKADLPVNTISKLKILQDNKLKPEMFLQRNAGIVSIVVNNINPNDMLYCNVINPAGQTILKESAKANKKQHVFTWNHNKLATGIYFVTMKTPGAKLVKKLAFVK